MSYATQHIMQDKMVAFDPLCLSKRFYDGLFESQVLNRNVESFLHRHPSLDEKIRQITAGWMRDVLLELGFDARIYFVAVHMLDRFIQGANFEIAKSQMQAVACACLLVASKVRNNVPLTTDLLCHYTAESVPVDLLRGFEALLLAVLGWDTCTPIAYDFLEIYLSHVRDLRVRAVLRKQCIPMLRNTTLRSNMIDIMPSQLAVAVYLEALNFFGACHEDSNAVVLDLANGYRAERLDFKQEIITVLARLENMTVNAAGNDEMPPCGPNELREIENAVLIPTMPADQPPAWCNEVAPRGYAYTDTNCTFKMSTDNEINNNDGMDTPTDITDFPAS